jgi:Gram-negative bacterial TonB protein C-terminal
MPPTPLNVENLVEVALIKLVQGQTEPPALTFPDVSHGYLPGRALFLSSLVHELIIVALLLLSFTLSRTHLPASRSFNDVIKLSDAKGVVYLPVLGGGSEGSGHTGGSPGVSGKESSPSPSRSSKGMAFPGPQPILSNPPDPTNQRQTIIQPAKEKPRVLQEFVPLPNMVKIAKPHLPLPSDLVSGTPDLPEFHPAVQAPAAPPRIALPATAPPAPIRPTAEAPKRAAGEKEVAPPKLKLSQTLGADEQELVSLSPTPTLPEANPEMPLGEARGRFAVSPTVNLAPENAPGSKVESPGTTPAIGQTAAAAGNDAGQTALGAGNSKGSEGTGGGLGVGTGSGADTGPGKGGTGTGSARGSSTGTGIGTGPGPTSASGAGAGSATGRGGLPGLTIQRGGAGGAGISVNGGGAGAGGGISVDVQRSVIKIPPQTAYGMTITSTADSGGGLPDLGVFAHEKVYTVFLDMREKSAEQAPSWTLQYARLQSAAEKEAAAPMTAQEALTPPFPLAKELPKLNSELMRRYLRNVIVVYAVLDKQGKLQHMSVRQSPDTRFSPPILAALTQWTFQPAQLNGQPVALKVLIGIPLLPY